MYRVDYFYSVYVLIANCSFVYVGGLVVWNVARYRCKRCTALSHPTKRRENERTDALAMQNHCNALHSVHIFISIWGHNEENQHEVALIMLRIHFSAFFFAGPFRSPNIPFDWSENWAQQYYVMCDCILCQHSSEYLTQNQLREHEAALEARVIVRSKKSSMLREFTNAAKFWIFTWSHSKM